MTRQLSIWLQLAIGAAILLLLPALLIHGAYGRHLLTLTLILACLGVSLNLVMGYAGLVSVAHGAFFGIGAYATGVMTAGGQGSFVASVVAGMVLSGLAGALLGAITLRLRGHYFALSTLAFTMVSVIIFERWEEVTRGARGISNIPRPTSVSIGGLELAFTGFWGMYVLLTLLLCGFLLVCHLIVDSPFGRSLLCIRRNELLGAVYGVNIVSVKLRVFALSAAMASVSGSFYASYIAYIAPADANFMRSFEVIMYVVVGGAGTLWGPVLGAAFVHLVPEFLRGFEEWRLLILGLVLVCVVRFYPAGLSVGILQGARHVVGRLRAAPVQAGGADGGGRA